MTTKEQIITSAREVFEKFGFNKTSIGDIVGTVRKSRRTFYTYFESKEEVFKEVIEAEIDSLAAKLKMVIELPEKPSLKLKQYFNLRMEGVKQLTVYYDAIRRDLAENYTLIEKIRKKYDDKEVEMLTTILNQGVEHGEFEVSNTSIVANAILLACKGFELPLIMGQGGFDHNQFVDPLIDLFYTGILKKS